MKSEEDILKRLKRRLRSARASVMLEFAFVAPLAMLTLIFAADFTRILRTEQQLEIATRLAADVEAHMADYYGKGETPCKETKGIAKGYLADIAQVVENTKCVCMKGDCKTISNPISAAAKWVADLLSGDLVKDSNLFIKIVAKIFGTMVTFLSFNTFNYITDVAPHDREVWITTAAYIPTILPPDAYSYFSLPKRVGTEGGGDIGVGQFTYDYENDSAWTAVTRKIDTKNRHRVYCHMPVIDSVPIAPKTYVRVFKSWCARQPFLKGLLD